MSWKIDDIDFEDYSVYVSRSSGVLDLPRMVDKSTNWLDENGKDYWQAVKDVKFGDQDINLSCFIVATDYADFKAKLAAFFTALSGAGKRALLTPFGNTIEVSLQDAVSVSRLTSYVQTIQVGLFNLRLIVSGDTQTKLITVYDPTDPPTVRGVYKYRSDAKLTKRLMGEDQVTLSIEDNEREFIGRGSYILVNGEKYIQFESHDLTKHSTNKYVQSHQFDHEFFWLKYIQFRINDVADCYYYGTLEDVIDRLIENTGRNFAGLFEKGTVEASIYKNHQFQNESCYDVLSKICQTYEVEFEHKVVAGKIRINIATQVGNLTGTHIEYGKGKSLTSIKGVSGSLDNMVTRLYAYGSAKNIPVAYKGGGKTRLELATMPLVKDFYGFVIEKTKVWDDIFPERTGTVTSYTFTPSPDPENYPERATHKLVDENMPFDLKKKDVNGNTVYLIAGTTAKMHFNSGDMAGFELEVLDYDHATKTYMLTPLKEANGLSYPNADLFPGANNEYKLLDINLPQSYIDDAEARLLARAQEYINIFYQPIGTYNIEVHPAFTTQIEPGDILFIDDAEFTSETDPQRVSEVTTNLYSGGRSATISQVVKMSNMQLLRKQVNTLEKVVSSVAIADVNDQRRSSQTSGEVKNVIVDPLDEKLRADDLVRDESIDARMLSYETGVPQFEIEDALVECNVDGNEDNVKVWPGKISMLNYRNLTLTRKEIEKLTGPYDPSRTWIIEETSFTLINKQAWNIYAKLDMTEASTTCTIEVFNARKRVKEGFTDPGGYIRFKIGSISSGEEAAV